jgi:hypothetical protein
MLQEVGRYPIQVFKVCQKWVVIPFRSWTRGFQSRPTYQPINLLLTLQLQLKLQLQLQQRLKILFSYGYRLGPDTDKRISKDYLKRIKVNHKLGYVRIGQAGLS